MNNDTQLNANDTQEVYKNRLNGHAKSPESEAYKGFLASIKDEKYLSYDHWRYRLLHWVFNVEDPKESSLPDSLYTHYCPLFHLTNILALALPIIMAGKMIVVGFSTMRTVIRNIRDSRRKKEKPVKKADDEALKQEELKGIKKDLASNSLDYVQTYTDFDKYWDFCEGFYYWEKEELREKYKVIHEKVLRYKLLEKERKDRLRARIVFWVNFSRGFIKTFLNVFYVGLFLGVAYFFTFEVVPVMASMVKWLFTVSWLPVLIVLAKATGIGALVLGSLYGLWKMGSKVSGPLADGATKTLSIISIPFSLSIQIMSGIFGYAGKMGDHVGEFISVFYEENCPPIKIVDEVEQEIAKDL